MGYWRSIKEKEPDFGSETIVKSQRDFLVCDFFLGKGIGQSKDLLRTICFVFDCGTNAVN